MKTPPAWSRPIAYSASLTLLLAMHSQAQITNVLTAPSLPDAGPSMLRVLGALAVVVGIFLGGVWLYRNGQRLRFRGGRTPRLNVLESRSLGGRHALYVIAYEQERFLVASTPTGINLLSHLTPASNPDLQGDPKSQNPAFSFGQTLAAMVRGQTPGSNQVGASK